MASGMWTKHTDSSGRDFYFNSQLNQSLWQPPDNSEVFHMSHSASYYQKQAVQTGDISSSSFIPHENTPTLDSALSKPDVVTAAAVEDSKR